MGQHVDLGSTHSAAPQCVLEPRRFSLGVEEEFLLLDPATWYPAPLAPAVIVEAMRMGVGLQHELTTVQVETNTGVHRDAADLRAELLRLRTSTSLAAARNGALLVAAGAAPLDKLAMPISPRPRYKRIAEQFGAVVAEQGVCGCHVHVGVPDLEAAVQVSTTSGHGCPPCWR